MAAWGAVGVWLGPQASNLCSVIFCLVDDGWMDGASHCRVKETSPQVVELSPTQLGSKQTKWTEAFGGGRARAGVGW